MATPARKDEEQVVIKPANLRVIEVPIAGTAPYLQNKFSQKAKRIMMEKMAQGGKAKSKKEREPRNFDDDFKGAMHTAAGGWHGIPATAFRAAMIDACRTAGVVMTRAKMAIFVLADGLDEEDGTPLVRLVADKPERHEGAVRNDSGVADIRIRPMWRAWKAVVRIKYDADMLTADTVTNLLDRAGQQVGVGEGRPFSKDSVGLGFGTFEVERSE